MLGKGTVMRRVDYWKAFFVAVCCAAVFGQSAPAPAAQAQEWEKAAGGKKAFDVASVKLDPGPFRPPNFPLDPGDAFRPVGDRFSADFAVFTYITFAYKVASLSADIRKAMQANLPEWVMTDRYAIEARADGVSTKDQIRLMMQSLLAERFGLKVHFENRTFPAFALELVNPGKTGPKLRPHSEGVPCEETPATNGPILPNAKAFPPVCDVWMANVGVNRAMKAGSRNTTLAAMAGGLPGIGRVDRPMVDRTGLTGRYDFTIEFAPEPNAGPAAASDAAADLPGPTFMQALKEQLGLKLESVKADFPLLVVDHIERPSGN
jgi:uncharacterized protein (TIGR03435 family)